MEFKGLSAYAVEQNCGFSNGYLKKQLKSRGSVGSDILEKIHHTYPDLSLIWLLSGRGDMIFSENQNQAHDPGENYVDKEEVVGLLKEKIRLLEISVADKEKIISLMEAREKKITKGSSPTYKNQKTKTK